MLLEFHDFERSVMKPAGQIPASLEIVLQVLISDRTPCLLDFLHPQSRGGCLPCSLFLPWNSACACHVGSQQWLMKQVTLWLLNLVNYIFCSFYFFFYACSLEGSYDKPIQHIKMQRHHFTNKGPHSQGYGFSSSHVWMWELDHKESWAQKN